VGPGFDLLDRVGLPAISAHVTRLTSPLLEMLRACTHRTGSDVFRMHGPTGMAERGGAVALNLLDARGRVIPYEDVERAMGEAGIAVRGGCFCNPGAAEAAFGFPPATILRCLRAASTGVFSPRRFGECLGGGVAVGAIRISIGAPTTVADLRRCVDALCECAVRAGVPRANGGRAPRPRTRTR
jgi:selenocysteine lyase/cysteine desulfurase